MTNRFDYLTERIQSTECLETPFRHLYIEDFFTDEDFAIVIGTPEVNIPAVGGDEDLISELHKRNFEVIEFPGTTTNISSYLKWHKSPLNQKNNNVETCEGFGLTFRLMKTEDGSLLKEINDYFLSSQFLNAVTQKFSIDLNEVHPDTGLQKYLDGYEISPHPDIRRKALTFMMNINPAQNSEDLDYHTHYMRFKPDTSYVQSYWEGNPGMDRCWVPWDWCETVNQQTRNNSIVIFEPTDDTIHAVKASYDHLSTQRTQFYGNLWFNNLPRIGKPNWRDFVVIPTEERRNDSSGLKGRLRSIRNTFVKSS